jgi:hypothetical protein
MPTVEPDATVERVTKRLGHWAVRDSSRGPHSHPANRGSPQVPALPRLAHPPQATGATPDPTGQRSTGSTPTLPADLAARSARLGTLGRPRRLPRSALPLADRGSTTHPQFHTRKPSIRDEIPTLRRTPRPDRTARNKGRPRPLPPNTSRPRLPVAPWLAHLPGRPRKATREPTGQRPPAANPNAPEDPSAGQNVSETRFTRDGSRGPPSLADRRAPSARSSGFPVAPWPISLAGHGSNPGANRPTTTGSQPQRSGGPLGRTERLGNKAHPRRLPWSATRFGGPREARPTQTADPDSGSPMARSPPWQTTEQLEADQPAPGGSTGAPLDRVRRFKLPAIPRRAHLPGEPRDARRGAGRPAVRRGDPDSARGSPQPGGTSRNRVARDGSRGPLVPKRTAGAPPTGCGTTACRRRWVSDGGIGGAMPQLWADETDLGGRARSVREVWHTSWGRSCPVPGRPMVGRCPVAAASWHLRRLMQTPAGPRAHGWG